MLTHTDSYAMLHKKVGHFKIYCFEILSFAKIYLRYGKVLVIM